MSDLPKVFENTATFDAQRGPKFREAARVRIKAKSVRVITTPSGTINEDTLRIVTDLAKRGLV